MRLILGSASPRRLELLARMGVVPDAVLPAEIDENPRPGELPAAYCARVAREKAVAVTADAEDVILTADTTVAVGRRILGKPADEVEARAFLKLLSGRRHRVISAVTARCGAVLRHRVVTTRVRLKTLSEEELASYLATGDWRGKAGAYAIQGPAEAFIPWISGSYSGVMGLPMAETAALLHSFGIPVTGHRA